jgi:RimJ/RimL family protein N-acetyltransferase
MRTGLLARQPELRTERLRLTQLGPEHFDAMVADLSGNEEGRRLTGTHTRHTEEQIRDWLAKLPGADDRADWAIVRNDDQKVIGEVVLNDLDADNQSMNYRISLYGSAFYGQGYGTEAGRAVINFGLGILGLHRISLGVYDFNERAQASYAKLGFVLEGRLRDALLWDGEWHDELLMSVLATDPRP